MAHEPHKRGCELSDTFTFIKDRTQNKHIPKRDVDGSDQTSENLRTFIHKESIVTFFNYKCRNRYIKTQSHFIAIHPFHLFFR